MKLLFWKYWDAEQKMSARRILGLLVAALTLFLLTACLSYLLHWQEDMSLLGGSSDAAANKAGTLGAKTGHLLVCELFGLASLALPLILAAVSARLLGNLWRRPLVGTAVILISATFVFSFAFAYIGALLGQTELFGGGLGGWCGAHVVAWADKLFGTPVTGIFIVILILCLLFFCSNRFNAWMASIGDRRREKLEQRRLEKEAEAAGKEVEKAVADEEIAEDEPVEIEVPEVEPQGFSRGSINFNPDDEEDELVAPEEGSLEVIRDEDGLDTQVREPLKPIDNRLDPPDGLPKFNFPSLNLLGDYRSGKHEVSNEELTRNNNKIRFTLGNYKIRIDDVKAVVGPTVTLYKVYPSPGVRIGDIKRLQEDIAMSLNANGVRVITLNDSVGIEVANDSASIVPLKALLNDDAFRESKADLPVAIGYTITQKVKVFDLADAPHLLIAGATKQGKSVGINVIVASLLYSKHPSELKFVFIDPKMVEFSAYSNLLHHYLAVLPEANSEEDERNKAIVKSPKDAEKILHSLCLEMDERYGLLSAAGVNNIKLYNEKYKERKLNPQNGHRFLPYLVTVVDEYADLTMTVGASSEARNSSRSITNSIIRLAQKGRAAGIHVILATQRPSVDVISGLIKSNFPMRIAFRVASRTDSMTIIDAPGAEKLIGNGDMLFSASIENERIQCGYVSGAESESITKFIGAQHGYGKSYNTPYYLPLPAESGSEGDAASLDDLDERFEEAARLVVTTQRGSTSDIQRRLGMGYAKAGRVMDQLESAGIVGPQEGSKPRAVLVRDLVELQTILDSLKR